MFLWGWGGVFASGKSSLLTFRFSNATYDDGWTNRYLRGKGVAYRLKCLMVGFYLIINVIDV